MGNPTGVKTFTAKGQTYEAVFTTNAVCRAEDRLNLGIGEIVMQVATSSRFGFVRAVLWAALRERHPKITEDEVGGLIDAIGIKAAAEIANEAFKLAFPDAATDEAEETEPPQAD